MELYEKYYEPTARDHDEKVHVQMVEGVSDPSCVICNAVISRPRIDFWNFWRWYRKKTGAVGYSERTVKRFYEYRERIKEGNGVGKLMETMRYNGVKIRTMGMKKLLEKIVFMFQTTDMFQEELEEEEIESIGGVSELSEYSDGEIESIRESYDENEDNVEISERFRKFWIMYKGVEKEAKSFNRKVVDEFNIMITKRGKEIEGDLPVGKLEGLQTIIEMSKHIEIVIENVTFRTLKPKIKWHIDTLAAIVTASNYLQKDLESSVERLDEILKAWRKEGKTVKGNKDQEENLEPMEKFWIWF